MSFEMRSLEVKKKKKLLGRGSGSGSGKTAGRGQKGQRSRSGGKGSPYIGFEGGQMPIYRRIAKRGFTAIFKKKIDTINIRDLDKYFNEGAIVGIEDLKTINLLKKNAKLVKLLGIGELSKKLTVRLHAVSKSAREKIEKAGGVFELV